MAVNHFPKQGLDTNTYQNQKYIPIHGPTPAATRSKKSAVYRALWRRPFFLLILLGLALTGLNQIWATTGYMGAETLLHWRAEIFVGSVALLTISLVVKIWQWVKARLATRERQPSPEIAVLHEQHSGTPTAMPKPEPRQDEFTLMIDSWVSGEPLRVSEQHMRLAAPLPDEFLAPDALVLNFHFTERLS